MVASEALAANQIPGSTASPSKGSALVISNLTPKLEAIPGAGPHTRPYPAGLLSPGSPEARP